MAQPVCNIRSLESWQQTLFQKSQKSQVRDLGNLKTPLLTQCSEKGILDIEYLAIGMVVNKVNLLIITKLGVSVCASCLHF